MKFFRSISILSLSLAAFSSFTFAADQRKSVEIKEKVTVAGQELKPGEYKLRWDDSKDTTSVSFQQYGKTVATAPARIVRNDKTVAGNYELNRANGSQLTSVDVSKAQLVFTGATQAENSSQTTTPPSQ